jgi:hypothetical protein
MNTIQWMEIIAIGWEIFDCNGETSDFGEALRIYSERNPDAILPQDESDNYVELEKKFYNSF